MSKFICFLQTKRWCEVSFCNTAASSSVGRKVCVHDVCIWWWRHCSLPQPSPTIMFRSGLTQWALWRLIWRWWGRRACLSSWSVHRSFYFPLKQGSCGVEPIERLPKAPKSRVLVKQLWATSVAMKIHQCDDRWGGEGGPLQSGQIPVEMFWQSRFLM